jgi:hypothetical protein
MSEPEVLWEGVLPGWEEPVRVLGEWTERRDRNGIWYGSQTAGAQAAGHLARQLRELQQTSREYRRLAKRSIDAGGSALPNDLKAADAALVALLPAPETAKVATRLPTHDFDCRMHMPGLQRCTCGVSDHVPVPR